MVTSIECTEREWGILKNAFRDAKLEIAHRCGYEGNMLPDGYSFDWTQADQYGSIPVIGDNGVHIYCNMDLQDEDREAPNEEVAFANYVNGELRVGGLFEKCRDVKDVFKVLNDNCMSKENLEGLVAAARRYPTVSVYPQVVEIHDPASDVRHVFFDKNDFTLVNHFSRSEGTVVMHDYDEQLIVDITRDVRESIEARADREGRVGVEPLVDSTLYFTGRALLGEGALNEHVGNGASVSVKHGSVALAVGSLREQLFREVLRGTEFDGTEVKAFYPKSAKVPYCRPNEYGISCGIKGKPWPLNADGVSEATREVFSPQNVKALREELTEALRQAQVREQSTGLKR